MADTRGPNDPQRRPGMGTAMPTWGWAAIAGVVLLLVVLFMWPTSTTDQADIGAPPVTTPATPTPPGETPAQKTAPPQAPPAQSPPAQ